jgi:hypothetical protein
MPVGATSWSFTEDDFGAINRLLQRFLYDSNARCALLVDRSGQLVTTVGEKPTFDATAFATLTAADFSANDQLAKLIGAVDEASDIGAIERAGEFRGLYHVLGGRLSPLDGVGPEDLTIDRLVDRVSHGEVREVIIATNPSLEGEATALYVQRQLAPYRLAVTRIARGLPVGGDLEYADGVTIAQALSARREMA